MSSLKTIRTAVVHEPRPDRATARHLAAAGLRSASALLARLSRRLARPVARVAAAPPQLEFCAEAGAPEGALYVDGRWVGWINGVTRL